MGAKPNSQANIHDGYIHLSYSHDTYTEDGVTHAARHIGCTLGRSGLHSDASEAEALQTAGAFAGVVGAAARVFFGMAASELDDHFATLTTPADSGSPWPGVKPSDFWASLTTAERVKMATAIRRAAITAQFSA